MEKQPARNTDIDSTAQGSILLPTHWSILSSFVKFSLIDFHTFGTCVKLGKPSQVVTLIVARPPLLQFIFQRPTKKNTNKIKKTNTNKITKTNTNIYLIVPRISSGADRDQDNQGLSQLLTNTNTNANKNRVSFRQILIQMQMQTQI